MAGGGARGGTLVIHYGTGHRRPAPRARQPRDEPRSCGSQPAHQSVLDRRLSRRPLPCAIIGRTSCFRTDRRRTPMPPTIESGHESGQTQTEDTLRRGAVGRRLNTTPGRSEGSNRQRRTAGCWSRSLGSHPPGLRQQDGPGSYAAGIMPRAERSWRGRPSASVRLPCGTPTAEGRCR
jgi:hypothetical protein